MTDRNTTLREEIATVAPFANSDESGRYNGEADA